LYRHRWLLRPRLVTEWETLLPRTPARVAHLSSALAPDLVSVLTLLNSTYRANLNLQTMRISSFRLRVRSTGRSRRFHCQQGEKVIAWHVPRTIQQLATAQTVGTTSIFRMKSRRASSNLRHLYRHFGPSWIRCPQNCARHRPTDRRRSAGKGWQAASLGSFFDPTIIPCKKRKETAVFSRR